MAEKTPQTYANHTRLDPPFHFFVVPVFGITVLLAIWNLVWNFSFAAFWTLVVAMAAVVLAFKTRLYALRTQDRVIRLEERLRLLRREPESLLGLRIDRRDVVPRIAERDAGHFVEIANVPRDSPRLRLLHPTPQLRGVPFFLCYIANNA